MEPGACRGNQHESLSPGHLNRLAHACRLCGRTLTTLGNLHMYMEGGHMRMGLCVIHKELIEELRQDIAAAFTCLSGLILRNESGQGPPLSGLPTLLIRCMPPVLLPPFPPDPSQ